MNIKLYNFFFLFSRWVNDPQFVGSFETKDHVYFLFREIAVEYINCGKVNTNKIIIPSKYESY